MKTVKGGDMGKYLKKRSVKSCDAWLLLLIIFLMVGISGCSTLNIITGKESIKNLGAPPGDLKVEQLEPGLSVLYFHGFYRNLSQLPRGKRVFDRGIPGKPILYMDHQFGEDMVFDSGRSKGVGMQMDGFIRFETPGDYTFQARTNDGFRLVIDEQTIINDPAVHSDRMSERTIVRVPEAGWYPMKVLYFQRKGTATLQLFWQKPGDKKQRPVPAEVYAHLP